ncbi:RNA 2',3'-cyclic phosphodiesterase [Hyperthermus butylicus]|uniref:RNA 2',3'-cyclic phosphodiesterase n=1 Tax=Hyperthermus butylicus (strain DSM 5456 / JCM 9403 / PLM1-5) TaxID=415426 RepID=A2BJU4_HYPBU|nr:RNA 2',3'-cyclic phosphodiesterase [Hyperthermus butylicus]ABM80255.1 2'-5' RNA ligase, Lig T [Hyperthermus butylicus DSM 5456]
MSYERIRAFIAVDIEDPSIVAKLVQIRDSFVATGAPMKPVEDQNLHITLRFLGNIPLSLVDEIEKIIRDAKPRRVVIRIRGVGAFPSPARPRVVWVGVEEGEGAKELERLYREIERGLRRLGFKPEREEFVPHVTLARLKGSRNIDRVVKLLNELADIEVGEIVLESVRLKQSILTPRGPIYKTLREVKAVEA